jgi:hypothetical protein
MGSSRKQAAWSESGHGNDHAVDKHLSLEDKTQLRAMENSLHLMVTYLVHLQFYDEEEDILYSRDKKVKVSIPGIKPVIQEFVNELLKHLDYLKSRDYRGYIDEIAKVLPINADVIEREVQSSIEILPENELTAEMMANFTIGPIRSALHKTEFENFMSQVVQETENKIAPTDSRESVQKRLEELYSINDESVSLLYNLVVVRLLASIFSTKDLVDRIESLIEKHRTQLIEKIIQ